MNYPVLSGMIRINMRRTDYAELDRWRRLALTALTVCVFLFVLLLTGACSGH